MTLESGDLMSGLAVTDEAPKMRREIAHMGATRTPLTRPSHQAPGARPITSLAFVCVDAARRAERGPDDADSEVPADRADRRRGPRHRRADDDG